MKKGIIKFIGIILGVAFGFLVFSFFVPKTIEVSKSVTIEASQEEVFNFMKSFKNVSSSTIWEQKDANIKKTFKGAPDGTIGAIYRWKSQEKEIGVGEQEVTGLIPYKRIDMEVRLEEPMKSNADASFVIDSLTSSSCQLTWNYKSEQLPIPINGFVYLLGVSDDLKEEFSTSLQTIKHKLEQ